MAIFDFDPLVFSARSVVLIRVFVGVVPVGRLVDPTQPKIVEPNFRTLMVAVAADADRDIVVFSTDVIIQQRRLLPCALRVWWWQALRRGRIVIGSAMTGVSAAFTSDQHAARYSWVA